MSSLIVAISAGQAAKRAALPEAASSPLTDTSDGGDRHTGSLQEPPPVGRTAGSAVGLSDTGRLVLDHLLRGSSATYGAVTGDLRLPIGVVWRALEELRRSGAITLDEIGRMVPVPGL